MAFSKGGFFIEEFETVFKEQFKSTRVYESIVAALSKGSMNLTDLAKKLGVAKGGGFGKQMENLVRAQFVREYVPVSIDGRRRTRTKQYKLVDPFLNFYFRYIHHNRNIINRNAKGDDLFKAIAGPTIQQYYGYAFERLCEDALDAIWPRLDLTLADIQEMGPFFQQKRGTAKGLQIDWLILRRDKVWTLLEQKYSTSKIGTNVIVEVEEKMARLSRPDHITIEPVLITAAGATKAVEKRDFFTHILTLKDIL